MARTLCAARRAEGWDIALRPTCSGITRVLAFVHDFDIVKNLAAAGMLL